MFPCARCARAVDPELRGGRLCWPHSPCDGAPAALEERAHALLERFCAGGGALIERRTCARCRRLCVARVEPATLRGHVDLGELLVALRRRRRVIELVSAREAPCILAGCYEDAELLGLLETRPQLRPLARLRRRCLACGAPGPDPECERCAHQRALAAVRARVLERVPSATSGWARGHGGAWLAEADCASCARRAGIRVAGGRVAWDCCGAVLLL
jgi:hypothetical protein